MGAADALRLLLQAGNLEVDVLVEHDREHELLRHFGLAQCTLSLPAAPFERARTDLHEGDLVALAQLPPILDENHLVAFLLDSVQLDFLAPVHHHRGGGVDPL